MSWIEVGLVEAIPRQGARVVVYEGEDIALFRTYEDKIFALRDRCPHRGGPLSQGLVYEERVACPLHDWKIDLARGCAIGPDEGCTMTYPVRIAGGHIYIDIRGEGQDPDDTVGSMRHAPSEG